MAKVMDDGLKQRLIGAVVLLAIAVIFIPVLFDRNTITPVDTTSQVPPMPQIAIEPIPVAEPPVVVSPAPEPETMLIPEEVLEADSSQQVEKVASNIQNDTQEGDRVEQSAAVHTATKQPQSAKPSLNAAGVPNGWLLQVISYSEESKAKSFRDRLVAKNYPAFMRKANTSKGTHYRVFIGPKLDRAEILKIKTEVDKAFNLKTWVVNMTPGS